MPSDSRVSVEMRSELTESARAAIRSAARDMADIARRMQRDGRLAPPRRHPRSWRGRAQWWRSSWSEETGGHYGRFVRETPERAAELRRALWFRRTRAAKEAIRRGR